MKRTLAYSTSTDAYSRALEASIKDNARLLRILPYFPQNPILGYIESRQKLTLTDLSKRYVKRRSVEPLQRVLKKI